MPHALIPLIKRLADTHLTAVGCYVGSGGYSLFSVSPSKGWKPNGNIFLPPGKHREYIITVYWIMTINFFFCHTQASCQFLKRGSQGRSVNDAVLIFASWGSGFEGRRVSMFSVWSHSSWECDAVWDGPEEWCWQALWRWKGCISVWSRILEKKKECLNAKMIENASFKHPFFPHHWVKTWWNRCEWSLGEKAGPSNWSAVWTCQA